MIRVIPVILAGGIGSRLWPLSTEDHPKQFIRLPNNETMLKKSYRLGLSVADLVELITVTNERFYLRTKAEFETLLENRFKSTYILEPFGKNTAPAIAAAALHTLKKHGNDAILLVMPADHIIKKSEKFLDLIKQALALAGKGKLVTFGIKPDSPQTGYGYIELTKEGDINFFEKPDLERAKRYLKAGNFFWNSGIFLFSVGSLISEMNLFEPGLISATKRSIENASVSEDDKSKTFAMKAEDFSKVKDISIDYAVMEKSAKIALVNADIGWSDLGSWTEFANLYPEDKSGNKTRGNILTHNVENCIIHSDSEKKVIAGIALKNLLLVDTDDALLVGASDQLQDIKTIVNLLKDRPLPQKSGRIYQENESLKIDRFDINISENLDLSTDERTIAHFLLLKGKVAFKSETENFILNQNESKAVQESSSWKVKNLADEPCLLLLVSFDPL